VKKSTIKSALFAILTMMTFSGCCIGTCDPEIKYIDKPYKVNVPVKCIVPDANCSFDKNTSTEVISSMLECIIDMKHNEEVCK